MISSSYFCSELGKIFFMSKRWLSKWLLIVIFEVFFSILMNCEIGLFGLRLIRF